MVFWQSDATMHAFTVILLVFVHCYCLADGKTVSGVFRSHIARENNGQYITRFLFHGESNLLVFKNNSNNVLYDELFYMKFYTLFMEKQAKDLCSEGCKTVVSLY